MLVAVLAKLITVTYLPSFFTKEINYLLFRIVLFLKVKLFFLKSVLSSKSSCELFRVLIETAHIHSVHTRQNILFFIDNGWVPRWMLGFCASRPLLLSLLLLPFFSWNQSPAEKNKIENRNTDLSTMLVAKLTLSAF